LLLLCFDLLFLDGKDLRELPLSERKQRLRKLIPSKNSRLLYVDHIDSRGCALFEAARRMDLEGIVAKRKSSPYRATEKPSPQWIEVKNPRYRQAEGREELFERS
jgi:bifunctional non-homologous end joining protein LigD